MFLLKDKIEPEPSPKTIEAKLVDDEPTYQVNRKRIMKLIYENTTFIREKNK